MYALMISAFVRRELQLSFYANEITSPVHGIPCREERSVEFYSQCFKNPETVTSKVLWWFLTFLAVCVYTSVQLLC